jgi:hypothetical protein
MPGPLPKKSTERRRRNSSGKARTIEKPADLDHVPKQWRVLAAKRPRPWVHSVVTKEDGYVVLDRIDVWHDCTRDWWAEIVASPMSKEFEAVDWHGLLRLALLVDNWWWSGDDRLLAEVAKEQQSYGLTPIDRQRLRWESAKGEQAQDRRRRSSEPAESAKAAGVKAADPRLRLVK